jgi:hypothetical protein
VLGAGGGRGGVVSARQKYVQFYLHLRTFRLEEKKVNKCQLTEPNADADGGTEEAITLAYE